MPQRPKLIFLDFLKHGLQYLSIVKILACKDNSSDGGTEAESSVTLRLRLHIICCQAEYLTYGNYIYIHQHI